MMTNNKWWHGGGTRFDAYLAAILILCIIGMGVLFVILTVTLVITFGYGIPVLVVAVVGAVIVSIAETIHARSHRGR